MPIRREEDRTKKLLFTAVVGFVLVSSIIGFTFSAIPYTGITQDPLKFNGVELFPTNEGFATVIEGQIVEFTYHPQDLSSTDVSSLVGHLTSSKFVYATSDPNSTMTSQISGAEFDIGRVMDSRYGNYLDVAFTEENEYGKQVITCSSATPLVPVLFFNFTNSTTEITERGNCVTINFGSESALYRIRDRTVYGLLGVIP